MVVVMVQRYANIRFGKRDMAARRVRGRAGLHRLRFHLEACCLRPAAQGSSAPGYPFPAYEYLLQAHPQRAPCRVPAVVPTQPGKLGSAQHSRPILRKNRCSCRSYIISAVTDLAAIFPLPTDVFAAVYRIRFRSPGLDGLQHRARLLPQRMDAGS